MHRAVIAKDDSSPQVSTSIYKMFSIAGNMACALNQNTVVIEDIIPLNYSGFQYMSNPLSWRQNYLYYHVFSP